MSFFDYLFDSEWRQRSDIEDLKRRSRMHQRRTAGDARRRASKVKGLEKQVEDLQEQVGALELLTRTMLQTLRATPNWNEDEFRRLILEIDMEDGVQDGRVAKG